MGATSLEKQLLIKGLAVGIGEAVFGLNGPFLFQRFGLNIPEAAALGAAFGAVAGYGLTDFVLRRRNRKLGVSAVPLVTDPEVPTGLEDLQTGGPTHTVDGQATKKRVEDALAQLEKEAAHIRVEVRDSKVVLKGKVHSWKAEAEAERIAFDMPGIAEVDNRLEVVQ